MKENVMLLIEDNPDDSSAVSAESDLPQKSYFGPSSASNFTLSGIIGSHKHKSSGNKAKNIE